MRPHGHGRADHRDAEGVGGWSCNSGCLPKHGISSATFYTFKAKYGAMDVWDARRLKTLEDETPASPEGSRSE
jgi:hypothetical protein